MKKGTKIGLGAIALLGGAMILTGCTNSFCSKEDKAHILYGIDHGVCEYFATEEEANTAKGESETTLVGQVPDTSIYYAAKFENCGNLNKIKNAAEKSGISVPSLKYYVALDHVVLDHAIQQKAADDTSKTVDEIKTSLTVEDIGSAKEGTGFLYDYGYLKFYGTNTKESKKLWENWVSFDNEVRTTYVGAGLVVESITECPNSDFLAYYKKQMTSTINAYRSCLAISSGNYGKYGAENIEVQIQAKSYGYAWKNGPLSGLLVWPIGALIDVFTVGMAKAVGQGWAQLFAILFVTIIVRALMLAVTFKQTTASSKMQELQPEIAKIQAKYPNSNTNQYEKQRLAMETQALYKKHKINPLTSIIVMIVQFPIFICVWGAMQGSAQLSSGQVLGLNLSTSISSVLTTWSNWANPASGVWTALVLFLLMAGAQTVAMLLPQWLNSAKKKKVAKLGRNPAQKESDNKMKWFTYIMLAMIIFMGFSLVSALGVYWLVGALFSIAQTLITHAIMNRKKSK